tara:strand:+ start:2180 stop:2431 length:252 start_codon:yes stop_codon:yes gene_type:complete
MKKNSNKTKLLSIYSKKLKIKEIELIKYLKKNKDLRINETPGWDSFAHTLILIEIEKKFKIKITADNAKNFFEFKKTLNFLNK